MSAAVIHLPVAYDPRAHGADCDNCPCNGQVVVPPEIPKGKAAAIAVGMEPGFEELRQGKPFCLVPETLVLTSKLTWKPLSKVTIGDELIGIDEHPLPGAGVSGQVARRWQIAIVTAVHHRRAECWKVTTPDGELVGTGDHRVLVSNTHRGKAHRKRWMRINQLSRGKIQGSHLVGIGKPWNSPNNYEIGWLAGVFDGEGCVLGSNSSRVKHAGRVVFTQNKGFVLRYARSLCKKFGFRTAYREKCTYVAKNGKVSHHGRFGIQGGQLESMRFLGTVRPKRLIENFQRVLPRVSTRKLPISRVTSRIRIGERDVIDITTTAGTFVANGFIVHNCGVSGKKIDRLLARHGIKRARLHITNAALCIDGRTMVRMGDGSLLRMDRLVKTSNPGPVLTVLPDGTLGKRSITNWYRNPVGNRRILYVTHEFARSNGNGGTNRALMTEDHPILTQDGSWIAANSVSGQMIATGDEAPGGTGLDIAIGTLLGDGCIPIGRSYLQVSHAEDQREYAELKAVALKASVRNANGRNGWQSKVLFNTYSSGFFRKLRTLFYPEGKKRIPTSVVSNISDLSLAIWFLDDGYMRLTPAPQSLMQSMRGAAEICVAGFPRQDVKFAVEQLRVRGFDCHISNEGRPNRILFTARGSFELSKRIARFVPPSMQYKIFPDHYDRFDRSVYESSSLVPFYDKAVVRESKAPTTSVTAYCIDVEETHCFVVTGAVVHNCRAVSDEARLGAFKACAPRLQREINSYPKEIPVVTLGAPAFQSVIGRKLPISLARGFVWQKDGRDVLPTLHPAFVLRDATQGPLISRDFRRLSRRIFNELELLKPDGFAVPTSERALRRATMQMHGPLVVDIETTEEPPTKASLLCIGIGDLHRKIAVIPWNEVDGPWIRRVLSPLLVARTIITHNGPAFDQIVLSRYGMDVKEWDDTLIAHHAFAAHMAQRLDHVVSFYLDTEPWKIQFGKRAGGASGEKGAPKLKTLDEDQLHYYNACDVLFTAEAWLAMQADLKVRAKVYEADKRTANLCRAMQETGIRVDMARREELSKAIKKKEARLYRQMAKTCGHEFTPTKTAQIRKILFTQFKAPILERTEKELLPSTGKKVLQAFAVLKDKPYGVFCKDLIEHRGCGKMNKTYLINLPVDVDERVRAGWRSFGTVGSRLSCRKPNLQNLKRMLKGSLEPETRIREIYIPSLGRVFVSFDASQIEARVAGRISEDEVFIANCESGDIHTANARIIFGDIPELDDIKGKGKNFRDIAKTAVFAVCYGAEAATVYENLCSQPEPICTVVRQRGYGAIVHMLERMKKAFKRYYKFVEDNVDHVRKHGWIKIGYLTGRLRWFDRFIEQNKIANAPVQTTAGEIINNWLWQIDQHPNRPSRENAPLVAQVHDQGIYDVKEELADDLEKIIREVTSKPIRLNNGQTYVQPIDLKRGYRWSEL